MTRSARLNARVDEETLDNIDWLIENGMHDSRSEVLRAAIARLVEEAETSHQRRRISISLPRALVDRVEWCVEVGLVRDMTDAILLALRPTLDELENQELGDRQRKLEEHRLKKISRDYQDMA